MKKFISLGLSATLFMSACAPQEEAIRETAKTTTENKTAGNIEQELVSLWKELNVGDKPNLATAEIVFRAMSEETRRSLRSGPLGNDRQFLNELSSEKDALKKELLFGKVDYQNDMELISGTAIYSRQSPNINAGSFVAGFDWSHQREVQERAARSINDLFTARSQELSKDIAKAVVKDLSPSDIKKIEATKGTRDERIKEILQILLKVDKVLANYNFHEDDQGKILLMTLVAGAITNQVMENKTIQMWAKEALDIGKTALKVKEVCALLRVANESRSEMKKNWEGMKTSLNGLVDDIKKIKDQPLLQDVTKDEAKRLLSDVIHGKLKKAEGDSKGMLSQKQKINESLESFVISAGAAADNLGTILKTADKVFAALNFKPDPAIAKALQTAGQVAQGVQLAQKVINAFSNAGVIGAIGAFTQGGGLGSLGIGGGDPMAADIAAIRAELVEIKKMQKKMMELQIETMKMIQELANLLQSYHIEQMYVLAEIRRELKLINEIQQIESHSAIKSCQMMMSFAMMGAKLESVNSGDLLAVPRSVAYSSIYDRKSLERFMLSVGENVFSDCQAGMNRAFGLGSAVESPLLLASNNDRNLSAIFTDYSFLPLVELAETTMNTAAFGLNVPANNIQTFERKWEYADKSNKRGNPLALSLGKLISVEALERYVSALLLMGPVVSYDKADWITFLKNNSLPQQELSWDRNNLWLKNALLMVQTALAQESLLAGEPILKSLSEKLPKILKNESNCMTQIATRRNADVACAFKQNSLIRKNLLIYVLSKRIGSVYSEGVYETALNNGDIASMEMILGDAFSGHIIVEEGVMYVDWNNQKLSQEALPQVKDVVAQKLIYSENVPRLVALQQKVIDAILEIKPTLLSTKAKNHLLTAIAAKN